ncbi:MAG: galactose-1-phosphate uridylyltransferase [Candidatus Altiarchaeota archaeon]
MLNELRKDYFLDRWVIIASGRGKRPTDFAKPSDDEDGGGLCFFCPGNEETTPPEISRVEEDGRWIIRVFPNKFPAVTMEDGPSTGRLMPARGVHEIVVENPEHGKSVSDLTPERMSKVIDVYTERVDAMLAMDGMEYALVFKNHGSKAGASLSHTHTQIASLPFTPTLVAEETAMSDKYRRDNGSCPICDIVREESGGERMVFEDEHVFAFTPYASRSPFEAWITTKKHVRLLGELTGDERLSIARALTGVLSRLRDGLKNPPYNYYIHYSPSDGDLHLHIEVLPKLNIWAGFEMGSGIVINTMPPETAAGFYRGV